MVFVPVGGLKDASYSPTTPTNETSIRAEIQGISDQLKDYINDILIPNFGSYATTLALSQVIAGQVNIVDPITGKKYVEVVINGNHGIMEVA